MKSSDKGNNFRKIGISSLVEYQMNPTNSGDLHQMTPTNFPILNYHLLPIKKQKLKPVILVKQIIFCHLCSYLCTQIYNQKRDILCSHKDNSLM